MIPQNNFESSQVKMKSLLFVAIIIAVAAGLEESKDQDIAPGSSMDILTRNSREEIGRKGKKAGGKPKGKTNKKQKKPKKGSKPKKYQRKSNKRGKSHEEVSPLNNGEVVRTQLINSDLVVLHIKLTTYCF